MRRQKMMRTWAAHIKQHEWVVIDDAGHSVDTVGYVVETTMALIAAVRALFRDIITTVLGDIIATMLVALAAEGLGSCWVSSTIFAADVVRSVLDLPADWEPLGAVAVGHPEDGPLAPRQGRDLTDGLIER